MTRAFGVISLIALLPGAMFCQPTAGKLSFDIADVHASPRREWVKDLTHAMQGGYLAGDRYELHRATMVDLIRIAYDVDAEKVFGGPSWLDYDRFEVVAKTKPGTRPEALRLMLQKLLEDRFHLVARMDTREVPGYVLSKGKREVKLKPASEASTPAGCQSVMPVIDAGVAVATLRCRGVTLDVFAARIRSLVSRPPANLPLVNQTGLEGTFDIDFQYGAATANSTGSENILEALDKLGLKVELGKVPQPVLVVESVNEQPSANPPEVSESLPPLPPPEFEVASVKWPCVGNASIYPRFETGGRVTATCVDLLSLIKQAWNLALKEEPAGLPKWLMNAGTSHNVNLVAKAPEGIAPDPRDNAQARDILNMMLRSLLIDRYQIKFHYEDRPMDAYTLTLVKPKLAKADPAGRTGCARESQLQQGRALIVKLVCRNITMAQFAEQIPGFYAEITYPVLDGTGLDGAWDFTLNFDAMAGLYARFPQFAGGGGGAGGEAADPSGALTFESAVEKQLGLRLETHKRPVPVLVLDHIEEKPIEN